jgi:D-lactate dehydrogenase (cytochrome)
MNNPQPAFFNINDYALFLSDESRLTGNASTVSFPRTEDEIVETCRYCHERGIPITVGGSRTGITGGAVPSSGHVISLAGMKRVLGLSFDPERGLYTLCVEPGLTLGKLAEEVSEKGFDTTGWSTQSIDALERFVSGGDYFFPPDPTETTASLGGMVACNASGARSFCYGSTRSYITGLRLVLADGRTAWVRRKKQVATGRRFSLPMDDGSSVAGTLPSYPLVSVKNAAGYFADDDMDLVDLFIGSEGTLAIASAIELTLVRKPKEMCGLTVFLASEDDALGFVLLVRGDKGSRVPGKPAAIEYFDGHALAFLVRVREENEAFKYIPSIPPSAKAAVYLEFHAERVNEINDTLSALTELIAECGGDENATWIATKEHELSKLIAFRHALPEAVNMYIASLKKDYPEITKLGTDMSVPDDKLAEMYDYYRQSLAEERLESVIFGHIGANHLHVNVLPKTLDEYKGGKEMYDRWAGRAVTLGGSVSAEHGIGKLKIALLDRMYGEKGIEEMRALKELFDPKYILGRGNLFAPRGSSG